MRIQFWTYGKSGGATFRERLNKCLFLFRGIARGESESYFVKMSWGVCWDRVGWGGGGEVGWSGGGGGGALV